MADMDDFDLDRSTAQAWEEFQVRLSEVISMIDDSGDLTIGVEGSGPEAAPFVRFSSPQLQVVRAEAAGSTSTGAGVRLDPDQLLAMADLGWRQRGPDQSPDHPYFWVEETQDESERVAAMAVASLRDVYGVPHPVFLAPDQLAEVLRGPTPDEPVAGLPALAPPSVGAQHRLDQLVDAELADLYGHPPIRDAEGDVAIRVGSTMLFLRTSPDGQEVVVFAAVVHDVTGRSRAAEVLNDLNVAARWVKFQLVRDRVFVTLSVIARPFVPEHLRHAVRVLSEVADGIDEELATKLNGRTTFSDSDGT